MAAPDDNESCHHVQNDPQWCKIKLEKFHFNVLWCYGVITESFPSRNPPGEVGLSLVLPWLYPGSEVPASKRATNLFRWCDLTIV